MNSVVYKSIVYLYFVDFVHYDTKCVMTIHGIYKVVYHIHCDVPYSG